jgi:Ca-activated chloride channel family protein
MAIDVSKYGQGFETQPNGSKRVAADFVGERPNDRIGLVVYASEAYTKPVPAIKL